MPCYDQSCTSADLVNIPSLVLSDTFNTWFDRTNQIIEVANAINIFDIGVGPTDGGLRLERGCSGSWYSGVAVLYVNPGAGIGIGTESFTNNYNKVIVDVARLQDYGGSTGVNPNGTDYYILSDTGDIRQGADGTPKRILARRILPNEIEFGEDGSGTLTIAGNLTVRGNVNIEGIESFIDSNDLRIEDKIIELAYGRYAEMTVFDDGSGTLTAGSFSAGLTAYYDDTQIPNEGNASTVGTVFSWSIGETGVSGTIRISSFTVGGVTDFESAPQGDPLLGGKLVVTGGGYLGVLDVTGSIGIGDYFLNDDVLQPAGIVIKGAEGDKTFLWVCNAADNGGKNWNAFVSNKNLGVSGPANWILSSKFASHGYLDPTVNNNFTFLGEGDSYTKYSVGSTLVMEHSPTGNDAGTTFGIVHMGSTGPHVLPGVPVYDWVEYFNADQLDGAHASTASVPWTIPIMGEDGRLGGDQVAADSIRKTFTVSGHAFSVGDVLRVNVDGSLTFSSADTIPTAEALGLVSAISGNKITLVTKGFISGLSGQRINSLLPLATGNVYYLSPTQAGGLINDPDSGVGIEPGEVRKAMLLAISSDSGYVLNYTGVVNGDSSDVVHMASFTPIGAIQPYAGPVSSIPRNWLLCDGKRLAVNDYSELYSAIGNVYYANATKLGSESVVIEGDTRGILVNDNLLLSWSDGIQTLQATAVVTEVDENTRAVTVNVEDSANGTAFINLTAQSIVKVYGAVAATNTSIFFIPDMRRRTALGSSTGTGISGSGNLSPSLARGDMGGAAAISLNQEVPFGSGAWGNLTSSVDSLPPHVTINWIIRTKKGADATILEGHNHDLFYVRYDRPHTIADGAENTLTLNDRTQFRSNARVLSNGADGPDTFTDDLAIDGSLVVNQSIQGLSIAITGNSSFGTINAEDRQHVFYGLTGSSFRINPPLSNLTTLPTTFMGISGLTGAVDVNRFPEDGSPFTIPVRYHTYEMLDSEHPAGQLASSAKAVQLTIQTDTGQVTCQPMYRVINRMPSPAERMRLPQGFLWVYSSETPPSIGGDTRGAYIKSGSEIHRITPEPVVPPDPIPTGGIIMWSGLITNIPVGWALCDGSQGTPDLRDKFIVGATADFLGAAKTSIEGSLSVMGGNKEVVLPNHRHIFGRSPGENWSNDDGFFIKPPEAPSNYILANSYNTSYIAGEAGSGSGTISAGAQSTATAPWVTTKVMEQSGNTFTEKAESTITTSNSANLPPYYALAFIMKMPSI